MHRAWFLAPLLVVAAAGSCFLRSGPTTPSPMATIPAPTTPLAPGTMAGSFFGINEALSVPAALVARRLVSGEQQRVELEADGRDVVALGARIVRANSHTYPFFNHFQYSRSPEASQARADRYFEVLTAAGVEMVAVIGPWPGIQTANYTSSYPPEDMDAYIEFVERIVERYDGDGEDDAFEGMTGVTAWEIDNEPDLHNRVKPRGDKRGIDPATFQTADEYAAVFLATAAAIRRADPDALILSAGMYNVRAPAGEAYLEAFLSTEGVMEAIDGLALHCYSDDNSLEALTQTMAIGARMAPGKPLWITETGVASSGKHRWQSEDWQAQMVVAMHAAALIGGVERLFWHTLADPPSRGGGRSMPFAHHSLMQTNHSTWEDGDSPARLNKPAGEAYRRLSAHLAAVARSEIDEIPAEGGRLMKAGDGLLAFWGTPILPDGDWVIEDLKTGALLDSAVAPAWITAQVGE